MKLRRFATILFSSVVLVAAAGCSRGAEDSSASPPEKGCIEQYDPERDYFVEKVSIEYARNFSVEYHKSYKVVTVRQPLEETAADEKYVLLQCGAPKPVLTGALADAPVISAPIRSLFSSSATHVPLLVDLGHLDVLTGISQARYVTTELALKRIHEGRVTEFAPNDVVDAERVISKSPAILMASGAAAPQYPTLRNAGIPVVANAEWQERTALGRAEWLKYMALFLNEEGRAQKQFGEIRDKYMALKERADRMPATERPRVMTGVARRGMFEIAGGQSYVAELIRDAGGIYVWNDNPSPGFDVIALETQIARAVNAEFWINGGDWNSLADLLAEESRYKEFKAFQTGNVWLYNRLVNAAGANDYWSRGITRPDLILGDLIRIFHPDLAADHEFVWYKQVPAK